MQIVTGMFDRAQEAEAALAALASAEIAPEDISVVANTTQTYYRRDDIENEAAQGAGTGAGLGAVLGGAGGLLAGLGTIAIPGLGPVIAGGWLLATAVGAVAGAAVGGAAGSIVGALMQAGVPEQHAHIYAEGVRRGGTLITVRAGAGKVGIVEDILTKADRVDPDERRLRYEQEGWQRFDPDAPDFARPQADDERSNHSPRRL